MAAPTSYTEATLATYMLGCLQSVAAQMGWTTQEHVQHAIDQALDAYGVTDVGAATDAKKLRALARREAWRQVLANVAGDHDFEADGGKYSRSQLHEMAQEEFVRAEADAARYDNPLTVRLTPVLHTDYPFDDVDSSEI